MNVLKIFLNDKIKNNFVYLPKEYAGTRPDERVKIIKIKKLSDAQFYYFGWMGGISSYDNTIELSYLLGKHQNLNTGDYVKVLDINDKEEVVTIDKLRIEPLSNLDYRMIEQNSEYFEENFLNQLMIVFDGMICSFTLYDNSIVNVKIKSDHTNKALIISQDCEVEVVYVNPPPDVSKEKSSVVQLKDVPFRYKDDKDKRGIVYMTLSKNLMINHNLNLDEYICYVELLYKERETLFRYSDMTTIYKAYETMKGGKESEQVAYEQICDKSPYRNKIWVNMKLDEVKDDSNSKAILVSDLRLNTVYVDGDSLQVNFIQTASTFNDVKYLNFICDNTTLDYYSIQGLDQLIVEDKVKNMIQETIHNNNRSVVFNYNIIHYTEDIIWRLNIDNKAYVQFFTQNKLNAFINSPMFLLLTKINCSRILSKLKMVNSHELRVLFTYTNNQKIFRNLYVPINEEKHLPTFINEISKDYILQEIKGNLIDQHITNFFSSQETEMINSSLILAPKDLDVLGFCNNVMDVLQVNAFPVYINFLMFNLNNYSDLERCEAYLKSLFRHYLQKEIYTQRRFIFFLVGLERFKLTSPDNPNAQLQSMINNSISYQMTKFIKKCSRINLIRQNTFYFISIMTGIRLDESAIEFFHNTTMFNLIKVKFLDEGLLSLFLAKLFAHIETKNLIELCRNFMLQDLIKIYRHFSHKGEGYLNSISYSTIEEYLSKYIPINILDEKIIKLDKDFSSIGGLMKVKDELRDTFLLSMKVEKLFKSKPPIQLSSGVLLIGPPGCGKTLVCSSLQKEFKINFFSIKGPEILNKYIGASEATVREIFENARKSTPCIIFFDELDSIAPKRGSGSSGVTDRIVNQLLTYLDGVESREGIFVIGASSRPDLIDPALLRPGRLDKILICDFPDENERREIIKLNLSLVSKRNETSLTSAIDHTVVNTDFYSGADLQSLVYNAFLLAVKRNIKNNLNEEPEINEGDLIEAFKESKRSMSDKEIEFHRGIKSQFISRLQKEDTNDKIDYTQIDFKTTLY